MPLRRSLLAAALSLALSSCFMLAREPDLSGVWRGTMTVDGQTFALAAQLREVEGRLEGPVVASGANATFTIFLRDEERVRLTGSYEGHGCSGTIVGDGALRDGRVMAGAITVEDTCSGRGTGTFELRRGEERASSGEHTPYLSSEVGTRSCSLSQEHGEAGACGHPATSTHLRANVSRPAIILSAALA
ncbi:MAG TPA: hypothetical protein VMK65_01225 [Longimicrobiales bacterium]|nr:hypothetical protein [Longimicrobiales bacterium]